MLQRSVVSHGLCLALFAEAFGIPPGHLIGQFVYLTLDFEGAAWG